MPSSPDVLIVGAGLAGLACARHLHDTGVSFQIVEASDGHLVGDAEPALPTFLANPTRDSLFNDARYPSLTVSVSIARVFHSISCRALARTIDALTAFDDTRPVARFSAFLGHPVEVRYRAGDISLPAFGKLVADSGRSIFLEQHYQQQGQPRTFSWEIPYPCVLHLQQVESAAVADSLFAEPGDASAKSQRVKAAHASAGSSLLPPSDN
jgi:hypothetical protein